ncbi:hypothetical protein NMY22_g15912 [Coprinellus aureogranulatus]|nr:hypothetical protein NMY22_g15912 [Coprinellus aureogranulatus]
MVAPHSSRLPAVLSARNASDQKLALGKRTRSTSEPRLPSIIVIDGADECDDRDDIGELIDHFLKLFNDNPNLPLRILFVSRIEAHIQGRLVDGNIHVENLHDYDAEEDIAVLVRHTFKEASKRDRTIQSCGSYWNPRDDIQRLIKHADHSFIFVRTLLNYIFGLESTRDDGLTPVDRLETALKINGLDGLYTDILKSSQHIPHFKDVLLAATTLTERLSVSGLAVLLNIPRHKILKVLIPLQSIVYVPADDTTKVFVFHASLIDFLRDKTRSGSILPPAERTHRRDYISYRVLEVVCLNAHSSSSSLDLGGCGHSLCSAEMKRLRDTLLNEPRRRRTCKFLISLALQIMTRRELDILLAHLFSCTGRSADFYDDSRLPWAEADSLVGGVPPSKLKAKLELTKYFCLTLDILLDSRDDGGIVAQWVAHETGIQLHDRPFEPCNDPSIHRCVVMHLTLDFVKLFPCRRPSGIPLAEYVEHWIEHLTLAITGTRRSNNPTDTVALSAFLQSHYPLPEVHTMSNVCIISSYWPDIRRAKDALEYQFPGMLSAATPLNEKYPGHYNAIYGGKGPTVVDMLNIFDHLLREPECSGLVRRTVLVHTETGANSASLEIALRAQWCSRVTEGYTLRLQSNKSPG